jgi:hypothetical protein
MPEPLTLASRSPRLSLPFLFAGQAQKEATVNEALARLDALVHATVAGRQAAPPAAPQDGQCWIVAASPTGAWAGKAGTIAAWCGGAWLFAAPTAGMRVWDSGAQHLWTYRTSWEKQIVPAAPTGGNVIDAEARTAISALFTRLVAAGVLAES